jgi:riboflavin kinase/FMN adenylyltransferase
MEIVSGTMEFHITRPTAVAIGKFDGIHRGHEKLLQEIVAQKQQGLAACVFTFDPSPSTFFGVSSSGELTTREEKRRIFAAYPGIDYLVEFPLNEVSAAMLPEDFVNQVLGNMLQSHFLVAGTDFTFGRAGQGNVELLKKMAGSLGMTVRILEKECCEGQEISSSWVRSAVIRGDMELVGELLGAPYTISGQIVEGQHLGRQIGFPTFNIVPEASKLLPPNGVYFTEATFDAGQEVFPGISNIGCKPTVSSLGEIGIETHICQSIQPSIAAAREMTIKLLQFHRHEKRFDSIEQLKKQIEIDFQERKLCHNLAKNSVTFKNDSDSAQ